MDVLEAMRRRRMHRYFDPAPLDDETLQTFAWAATRAPAGGNQPSRYVLVVKQPSLVKTLVEVTPSYIGTQPPAVILILTDVDGAERQMGAQGRDHLSRLDAGAAAEHVALGCGWARSRLLPVPLLQRGRTARCLRPAAVVGIDWLAAVGRPAATPSPAPKAPPQVVYVDRWGGEQWEVRRR